MNDPKVIVALDYDDLASVELLLSKLSPDDCRVKVGKELFTLFGPDIVKLVQDSGFQVFLDLKFHDIPATVQKACKAAASLGVWMLNVHALGGQDMLVAAKDGVLASGRDAKIIAVTILTSSNAADLEKIGLHGEVAKNVLCLTSIVHKVGLDGVVCSALEAKMIREITDDDFLLITPGIRPYGASVDDQKRVLTPDEAVAAGANYLVVGRPITRSLNPNEVLKSINESLAKAAP